MGADVFIAGAGPAGLVLAAVLTEHGVDCRVVDRKSGPTNQSRAAIVHVRTLELLDRLGLAGRAALRCPGGTEETISARWVVGVDGARSPVRHTLGVSFAGSTFSQTGLLADVELDMPEADAVPAETLRLNLTRGGFVSVFGLSNGRHRLFGAVPPSLILPGSVEEASHEAYAQVAPADIQRWLDDYFAVDAQIRRTAWTALFRIHSRIADRFRVRDVFLVGDAAHIHSPAGGQGMNLAIGDAVNLGWKLALVANGRAHDELLATAGSRSRPRRTRSLDGSGHTSPPASSDP